MTSELNFLDLFLKASIVVQLVILILVSFSIISWAIIIQRVHGNRRPYLVR